MLAVLKSACPSLPRHPLPLSILTGVQDKSLDLLPHICREAEGFHVTVSRQGLPGWLRMKHRWGENSGGKRGQWESGAGLLTPPLPSPLLHSLSCLLGAPRFSLPRWSPLVMAV